VPQFAPALPPFCFFEGEVQRCVCVSRRAAGAVCCFCYDVSLMLCDGMMRAILIVYALLILPRRAPRS